MTTPRMGKPRRAPVIAICGALFLAACGGDEGPPIEDTAPEVIFQQAERELDSGDPEDAVNCRIASDVLDDSESALLLAVDAQR